MSAVFNTPRVADAEACLAWKALQFERHEFVDGQVRRRAESTSDHNAAYDPSRKLELYPGIDTLTHCSLIEHTPPCAELFAKTDHGQWLFQPLQAHSMIHIERLGQPLPVAKLFEQIDFTPAAKTGAA